MQTAIMKVNESCGLTESGLAVADGVPTVADNNRALAELEAQLKGLG